MDGAGNSGMTGKIRSALSCGWGTKCATELGAENELQEAGIGEDGAGGSRGLEMMGSFQVNVGDEHSVNDEGYWDPYDSCPGLTL